MLSNRRYCDREINDRGLADPGFRIVQKKFFRGISLRLRELFELSSIGDILSIRH